MKLELVTRRDVSYVELQRDKKHSLGFTIKDGTQEDARPVVKCVKINGPAEKSFAVSPGDVVLSVNGVSTTGKKIKDVRRMLDDAGSNVNLQLQYKTYETRIQGCNVFRKQQLTVRLQKIKGRFGFLLRKCTKYSFMMEYPIISNIKEGSQIHKLGHVQDGDRLLMIDNIDLSWMPLTYVASLLESKDVTEFTIEYSVGVVNVTEMDSKIDLEIDAPISDLGISFRMCDKECSVMYISNIRKGSVADRCGIFSEGDVVSSINDTDTSCLTISKAYFLLRKVKKKRKISFILNREVIGSSKENTSFSSEDTASTRSFISGVQTCNWDHTNTPVSSNFKFGDHQKCNFHNFSFAEQIKSMDKFQSMLTTMSSLKQTLSALTCQAFKGVQIPFNQNCSACNNVEHAVKLCTSCLAKINVKCAQSIDVLRQLVVHFIRISSNMPNENDVQLVDISLKNVIHMLRETLPNIFRIPELKEELSILAEKVAGADTSCNICDKEIKNVMMISKQLLLVLSITDNSKEFTDLAEHLVRCLLDIKFSCYGGDSGYSLNSSSPEELNSLSVNLSESACIEIERTLTSDTCSHLKNNSDASSEEETSHSVNLSEGMFIGIGEKLSSNTTTSHLRNNSEASSEEQTSYSANLSESICNGIDEKFSSDTTPSNLKNNSEVSSEEQTSHSVNLSESIYIGIDEKISSDSTPTHFKNNSDASSEEQTSHSANLSESMFIGIDEKLFSDTMLNHFKNNSKANFDKISLESNYNAVQLKTEVCHDYLKLTHIQSASESKNSVSLESITEFNRLGDTHTGNNILPNKTISETYSSSLLSEDLARSRTKKFLKRDRLPRNRKSLNALSKVKRPPDIQNLTQISNQLTIDSQNETAETIILNQNVCDSVKNKNTVSDLSQTIVIDDCENDTSNNESESHSWFNKHKDLDATATKYPGAINHANRSKKCFSSSKKSIFSTNNAASNEDIATDVNSESTSSSSRFITKKKSSVAVKKTNPETMKVTLKKNSVGFGLGISDKLIVTELPVINAIEPKSASHKLGLLKLGDRILAINGVGVSKLSSRQFSNFKNKALVAETITLTVEFDVCDEKYKFGLFDVVLEKSLSMGLIFEEIKKGSALTVKGVEKGSAAYRSGQIFPTDQVTHVKYKKNEDFDPFTSSFDSEQNIIVTVKRDPKRLIEYDRAEKSALKKPTIRVSNPSPCYTNPCFQQEEGLTRNGQNFDVKKTAVHSSRKNSIVIDHEVTLYRDSLTFDFGILLSEDPATGRAYVSEIRPNGPADKSGVIEKLDRIIEVNGTLISGNVDTSVLDLITQANHKVDLLVRRVFVEK